MLSAIDVSTPDKYKIKYKIIYNNTTYEQTRVVIVNEKKETD